MNFYITHNGETLGPYTEEQTREKLEKGELAPADLGCREGEESWQPLSQMFPEASALSPAGSGSPASSGPRSPVTTFLLVFGGIVAVIAAVFGARMFFHPQPPDDTVPVAEAAPAPEESATPSPTPEMIDSPIAPGEKDLAIGAEVARGFKTIGALRAPATLPAYMQAISDVFNANKEKGTDSPGFLMGANYGAFRALSGVVTGPDVQKGNDATAIKIAKSAALVYFQEFRAIQTEQYTSDEEFVKAIGYRSPEENTKGVASLVHDEELYDQLANQ